MYCRPATIPLNPYKVIKKLWRSTPQTSQWVWQEYARELELTQNNNETMSEIANRVAHADCIDNFISRLFVDTAQNCLIYTNHPALLDREPGRYQALLAFWQLQGFAGHKEWYARYFDATSRCFIAAVYDASANRKEPEAFRIYSARAEQLCTKLHSLYRIIETMPYAHRYARQLRRYQELVNVLQSMID